MWQQLIDAVDHFRQGWYCGYDRRIGCIGNNVVVGVELERIMLAKAPYNKIRIPAISRQMEDRRLSTATASGVPAWRPGW